tara:strand:- start:536 stop:862 length:327 start_codon:yes stop_codon:yes gene_type:complete
MREEPTQTRARVIDGMVNDLKTFVGNAEANGGDLEITARLGFDVEDGNGGRSGHSTEIPVTLSKSVVEEIIRVFNDKRGETVFISLDIPNADQISRSALKQVHPETEE